MQMNPPSLRMVFPPHERLVVRRRSDSQLSARGTARISEKMKRIKNHDDPLCTSHATRTDPDRMSMSLKNRTAEMKIS